jgi:type IV secretion system protein VirB1
MASIRTACLVLPISFAFALLPSFASCKPLLTAKIIQLARHCAPEIPQQVLIAVAKTESGLDPLTLHDNTTGASDRPAAAGTAVSEAEAWIARGDSVDLGLMQVNSANLASLGMTVPAAFDACTSLAAGAAILQAAYGGGQTTAEQQVALLMALSHYNTGSPFRGILNGYVRKVMQNARSVPAAGAAVVTSQSLPPPADPNAPPSWDVWASASYAQSHGAQWLVPLSPGGGTKPLQVNRSAVKPQAITRPDAVLASTSAPIERSP